MVMEPMQGKLVSSQFCLGYTELFCFPEEISLFFSSCDSVFGDSLEFNLANGVPSPFLIGNLEFLCMQCRGIGPQLSPSGKSHGFFRVGAGTWSIFSIYGGDVHSKLEFVQRSQDTCLGTMDT